MAVRRLSPSSTTRINDIVALPWALELIDSASLQELYRTFEAYPLVSATRVAQRLRKPLGRNRISANFVRFSHSPPPENKRQERQVRQGRKSTMGSQT